MGRGYPSYRETEVKTLAAEGPDAPTDMEMDRRPDTEEEKTAVRILKSCIKGEKDLLHILLQSYACTAGRHEGLDAGHARGPSWRSLR